MPLLLLSFGLLLHGIAAGQVKWRQVSVLVYTKNGKGYVHENRAASVACIQRLGREHGFRVDTTNDPSVFEEKRLSQYDLLVFSNTNNDVFDTDAQRVAFRRYIESGGGLVGLHSVMGTERNWTWFKRMLGGSFSWHAPNQVFRIVNVKPGHASMKGVPSVWEKKDECYFAKELYPGTVALMAHDLASLDRKHAEEVRRQAGHYTDYYPTAWYHEYDGGHVWVTTLGHDIFNYEEPVFVNHVFQGIAYIASLTRARDAGRSYATERDAPLSLRTNTNQ